MPISKAAFLIVSFVGAALLTALVMHLALRRWRCSENQHWTARARLLYQARRAIIGASIGSLLLSVLAWWRLFPGEDGRWWMIGPILGVLAGNFPSSREIEPRYTFPIWLTQVLWAGLVQFGVMAVFLGLMFTMPEELRAADWLRAGLGVAAVAGILTGIWIPVTERLFGRSHPEEARLKRLVAEAAAQTGLSPRHVWLGVTPIANAAAVVYISALVVTTRLMEILNDEELHAVILHEMAHLKERLAVRLVRLAGALCWMSLIFIKPVIHTFGPVGVILLLVGTMLASRFSRAVAQRMEHAADTAAAGGIAEPMVYAVALEKLYKANQMPAVMRGKTVHPHLYDRMTAAGLTPDYPRPAPPGMMAWPGWIALLMPVVGFVTIVLLRLIDLRT